MQGNHQSRPTTEVVDQVQRLVEENDDLKEQVMLLQDQLSHIRSGAPETPLASLVRVMSAYARAIRPIVEGFDRDSLSFSQKEDFNENRRRIFDVETCRVFLMIVEGNKQEHWYQHSLVRFLMRKEHLAAETKEATREQIEAKVRARVIRQTEALEYFNLLERRHVQAEAEGRERIALIPSAEAARKAEHIARLASRL